LGTLSLSSCISSRVGAFGLPGRKLLIPSRIRVLSQRCVGITNYLVLAERQAPVKFSAKPEIYEENGKWSCYGSMTFWYLIFRFENGSGPSLFVSDFKDANK
jgi:hypothetical protein